MDIGRREGRQWKRVQRAALTCEGPRRHYLLAHRAEAEDLRTDPGGVHGPSDQVPSQVTWNPPGQLQACNV